MNTNLKTLFGKRFKQLRSETGLTQKELLQHFKIKFNESNTSEASISQYENGKRIPEISDLVLWAKYFDVTVDYLLGLSNTRFTHFISAISDLEKMIKNLSNDDKILAKKYISNMMNNCFLNEFAEEISIDYLPLLGQTAAGEPIEYVDIFNDIVDITNTPKNADFALKVNGDSMEPIIKNGSIIYIHSQVDVENGEIAIIEIDKHSVTCKKVYKENNKIRLVSINKKYHDMVFEKGTIKILGKVIL